jgi:hypothetical protein
MLVPINIAQKVNKAMHRFDAPAAAPQLPQLRVHPGGPRGFNTPPRTSFSVGKNAAVSLYASLEGWQQRDCLEPVCACPAGVPASGLQAPACGA